MKKTIRNYCLGSAVALCLSGTASAAWTFSDGDMMLGFRANGGTGNQKDLFFNLGSSVGIRDGVITGFRGNINDDLEATFGVGWFARTDLTFGAIANVSSLSVTDPAAYTFGQPDGRRITYLTQTASSPGAAADHPSITGAALGTVVLPGVTTLEGILGGLSETANLDGVAIFDRANAQEQYDQASWRTQVPLAGSSFTSLNNIGTAFGAGTVRYADIQRLRGSTNSTAYNNITVSTLAIDNLGNISLIPEPSSLTLAGIAALALVTRRRR